MFKYASPSSSHSYASLSNSEARKAINYEIKDDSTDNDDDIREIWVYHRTRSSHGNRTLGPKCLNFLPQVRSVH